MRRISPPTYGLVALLSIGGIALVDPRVTLPWALRLAGLPLIGTGVAVAAAAKRAFRTAGTDVSPFGDPTALVTEGWFRRTRNPMYVGMLLIVLGAAVLTSRPSTFAVPAALAILLDRVFVRREERMMRDRFPASFDAYARRVRRWL